MRTPLGAIIFISITLLLDTYVFQAIKAVSQSASPKTKTIIYTVYWTLTALAIAGFLLFIFTEQQFLGKKVRTYLFATIIGLFLAKITASVFFLIDDIRRGVQWAALKLFSNSGPGAVSDFGSEGISRSAFLNWLGLATGTTLFGSLLYGFSNKYNYDVKKIQLAFDNLPASFKGLKIVQISDIHSGSFTDKNAVLHGIEKILAQQPDLILFTGDLVNDRAIEMEEYMDVFGKLKAPMGVYSIFGNHDYGDYVSWPHNGVSKEQNLENLKKVHADLGWRLLMNEHVALPKQDFPNMAVWIWRMQVPKNILLKF
jgi:uncharacterized protein